MKTNSYNPSALEIEFANILEDLKDEMNLRLQNRKIESASIQLDQDNPTFKMEIADVDGDKHIMILKLIQRPDPE
jgi:hypothetical protein